MGDRISCNGNPAFCHRSKLVTSFAFPAAGRNFAPSTIDTEILASSFYLSFVLIYHNHFLSCEAQFKIIYYGGI